MVTATAQVQTWQSVILDGGDATNVGGRSQIERAQRIAGQCVGSTLTHNSLRLKPFHHFPKNSVGITIKKEEMKPIFLKNSKKIWDGEIENVDNESINQITFQIRGWKFRRKCHPGVERCRNSICLCPILRRWQILFLGNSLLRVCAMTMSWLYDCKRKHFRLHHLEMIRDIIFINK